jgi:chain length determinant protein (polysaccharide antigen chain regulator)
MLNNYYDQDDEIDLFQLFSNLWAQKLLIIVVTVLITAVGGFYAFLSTPIYESKLYLLPPTEKDTVQLKKLAQYTSTSTSTSTNYSTSYVYDKFIETLNSNYTKWSFFQRPEIKQYYMNSGSSELNAWEDFLKDLAINLPKKDKSTIDVSFKTDSAQHSAQWLNNYIEHVTSLTKNQLASDIAEEIDSRKEQIALQISSRIELYSSNLKKEIAKLTEALAIAKSLGLTSPLNMDAIDNEKNDMMIDEVRRLYKLGSHALEAEITALKNRKQSELFIPGLADLLQQQAVLTSLIVDKANIQPVQIDLAAQVTEEPIKPRKVLILAVSLILGAMLGIFSALIRSVIVNRKEQG